MPHILLSFWFYVKKHIKREFKKKLKTRDQNICRLWSFSEYLSNRGKKNGRLFIPLWWSAVVVNRLYGKCTYLGLVGFLSSYWASIVYVFLVTTPIHPSIYPSIHPLSIILIPYGSWGSWRQSHLILGERQGSPYAGF